MVPIGVNGAQISIEVDTGASVSIISQNLQHTKVIRKQAPSLFPSKVKLQTYRGEQLPILGVTDVTDLYERQQYHHSTS